MATTKPSLPIALDEAQAKEWLRNCLTKTNTSEHGLKVVKCWWALVYDVPICDDEWCHEASKHACACPTPRHWCMGHIPSKGCAPIVCKHCSPHKCIVCGAKALSQCQAWLRRKKAKDVVNTPPHYFCDAHRSKVDDDGLFRNSTTLVCEQCRPEDCHVEHCDEDSITKCTMCKKPICQKHGFINGLGRVCVPCAKKHGLERCDDCQRLTRVSSYQCDNEGCVCTKTNPILRVVASKVSDEDD
jgi:hypothetical protein